MRDYPQQVRESTNRTRGQWRVLVAALAVIGTIVLVGLLPASAGAAGLDVAAQENNTTNISDVAGYYNETNTSVANESWMDGRSTWSFDNGVNYLTRISTFLIGSGHAAAGGAGSAGALVTGIAVIGAFGGMMVGSGVGAVAGGVLGVATTIGVIEIGLAPSWLYAVVLFLIGGIATTAFVRSVR